MSENKITFPAFTLSVADCTGRANNALYPHQIIINNPDDLRKACLKDHCGAKLKDNYRKDDNFIECSVLMADIDNDDCKDPQQWITPAQVAEKLPGVVFYTVASRNNQKVKHPGEGEKERSERPRFHLYFPFRNPISDKGILRNIKESLRGLIQAVDSNAMDATRFFYGHNSPQVEYFPGEIDICLFFANHRDLVRKATTHKPRPEQIARPSQYIPGDFDREFIDKNIEIILQAIPAGTDQQTWSSVACSLKKDGLPFELFDRWSATSTSAYNATYKGKTGRDACLKLWNEKRPHTTKNLGIGWLYKIALQNDPSLPDRITKTGAYAKKQVTRGTEKKATMTQVTAPETNKTEVISGINVTTVPKSDTEQTKLDTRQQPEKVSTLEIFDSDFFNNTEIPEPVPIIDQILYPGLGMLGSPAKMGKSFMMLQLAVAVATGENFLGFEVKRSGSVLYLDLQGTKARTKKRLASMGYTTMPKGISLAYRSETTDTGFLEQLEQWIKTADPKPTLVIIDMLEQVKGSQRRTEDSYRADNRLLAPLHDMALKYDLSILGVMHTRKGNRLLPEDDPFNEIIGSVAQFGTADCAWMILGKREEDTKRLSCICRDNDNGQQDYVATFADHKWSVTGTVEEYAKKKATESYNSNPVVFTIRTLVNESGGSWYGTMSDLMQEVLNKTGEYPASAPKGMTKIVNGLSYHLHCEGIEIKYPDKNGGNNGRRYRFYQKTPEQQKMKPLTEDL